MCSNLQGAINFKNIWRGIGRCFGQVSRREKLFLKKKEKEVPCSANIGDVGPLLSPHTNALVELTDKIKDLFPSTSSLDITNGFMYSQTAEAVFNTLLSFVTWKSTSNTLVLNSSSQES